MWGGGRYEYETNVLLEIKRQGIAYAEEKIQTIYIENNQSSHFHPLLDSIRIYNIIVTIQNHPYSKMKSG